MAGQATSADAIIAGGGLHGLCTAIHLARAGMRVTLLEKDRAGRHASGANAGGVRRLGRALPEIPLADAALQRWHRITELVDDDCGFAASAQIKVAETGAELAALEARSQQVTALGFTHEQVIDQTDLRRLIPDVARHCVGGLIVQGDGSADPFRTVQAFRRKAVSLGVTLHERAPVRGVSHSGRWYVESDALALTARVFVNAAGAWGGQIAAMMGDFAPVQPQALMLMITERLRPFLTPVVGAVGRTLSFKQFDNGTVLIGGGHQGHADSMTNRAAVDIAGLATNAASAAAIFPLMKHVRITRAWAGIEGVMPDHIPVIGAGSTAGGFHLFGFSAHGFALSPICGQIIADLVLKGETSLPIGDFDVRRFA